MMKRCLSLLLVVGLIVVLAVPVSAADDSDWIELLESATVNDSGNNLLTVTGTSTTFRIKTPQYMRCTKIDLVITHPSGHAPTALYVRYNGLLYQLAKLAIDSTTTRFYGANIPDTLYADVVFRLDRSSTTQVTYQVVTCKVSPLVTNSINATGVLKRSISDSNPLTLPNNFNVAGDGSSGTYQYLLIPVYIYDWRKFDSITLYGSASTMAISSFRASIGNKGLPYEISYMQAIPTGFDSEGGMSYEYISSTETNYYGVDGTPDELSREDGFAAGETWDTSTIVYGGSVLFTVTIDLSGIDRTVSGDMSCFFTGIVSPGLGYGFNVQNASGTVSVADTSGASWWTRFTSFMNDLFGSKDSDALDDLGSSSDSISQNTSQIHDFEQSQQAVLDNNLAAIQGTITFTNFAAALVFVQKYTNMTFSGISQYAIVFTLPLFLGLFFYLCSRIPGITRWKTPPPRSPSPKSKGGGKT